MLNPWTLACELLWEPWFWTLFAVLFDIFCFFSIESLFDYPNIVLNGLDTPCNAVYSHYWLFSLHVWVGMILVHVLFSVWHVLLYVWRNILLLLYYYMTFVSFDQTLCACNVYFSPYSMWPGWSCMLQSYISFQRQVCIAFSCNSYFFVSFYYIIYVWVCLFSCVHDVGRCLLASLCLLLVSCVFLSLCVCKALDCI